MSWLRTYATICAGVLALVLVALALFAALFDHGLGLHGLIALFVGSLLTVALAMVLMGLVFWSSRAGHDASVHDDPGAADVPPDGTEPRDR